MQYAPFIRPPFLLSFFFSFFSSRDLLGLALALDGGWMDGDGAKATADQQLTAVGRGSGPGRLWV